ncbi:MAG: dihydroxyacetone kinase subunit L [bacterium]|nr:dihydroxyacetone kinase subunit L [bacterium]
MTSFLNKDGRIIVDDLIAMIQENAAYLSEIDITIGDGDHGINMKKGVMICQERLEGKDVDLSAALKTLGEVLFMDIGGPMGPLYGMFFREMAKACQERDAIDARVFGEMLQAASTGIQSLSQAKVGDKTLVDTLIPALTAYENALKVEKSFPDALQDMIAAAEAGKNSTKDLVAKIGRASCLGERSRGVLDTGATSCWLILRSMAATITSLLS